MSNNPSSFYIDVKELRGIGSETVHRLPVRWWTSVKEIKDQLRSFVHSLPSQQHIFFSKKSMELSNFLTLHDIGIESSGSVLRVSCDSKADNFSLSYSDKFEPDPECMQLINEVKRGLERNRDPGKSDLFDGTSGVYFMRSGSGATVAVFKPRDEEQGMPNNPKDHAGVGAVGLRENVSPGEGCIREQAAYLFDIDHFSRVPHTTLVHCMHPAFHYPGTVPGKKVVPVPKLGSLQRYMRSEGAFDDFGYNFFNDLEVQRIALLDLRLLNCDRNEANILVQRKLHDDDDANNSSNHNNHNIEDSDAMDEDDSDHSKTFTEWLLKADSHEDFRLIPIDHGYCLPTRLNITTWDWTWFNAPQVARPIHPEIKSYMKSIDIDAVINRLRPQIQLPENCFFLVRIAHQVIMEGIEAGLSLKDIARLIARDDGETPSRLELAIAEAEENAFRSLEIHNMIRSPATTMEGSISLGGGSFQSSSNLEKHGSTSEKTSIESIGSTPTGSPDLSPLKFSRKLSPGKYTPLLDSSSSSPSSSSSSSPRIILRGTPLLPVHEHELEQESVTGSSSESEDETSSSSSNSSNSNNSHSNRSPTEVYESRSHSITTLDNHHTEGNIHTRASDDKKTVVNYGLDYMASMQAISGKPLYGMQTLDSIIQPPQPLLRPKKGMSPPMISSNNVSVTSTMTTTTTTSPVASSQLLYDNQKLGKEDLEMNGITDESNSSSDSFDNNIPLPPLLLPSSSSSLSTTTITATTGNKIIVEDDGDHNYFADYCNEELEDEEEEYKEGTGRRSEEEEEEEGRSGGAMMMIGSPVSYTHTSANISSPIIRGTTSSPALEYIDPPYPHHHHRLHHPVSNNSNSNNSNKLQDDDDYNIGEVNFETSPPVLLERKSYIESSSQHQSYYYEGKDFSKDEISSINIYAEIDKFGHHLTTTTIPIPPVSKTFSTSSGFTDHPGDEPLGNTTTTTTTSLSLDVDTASYSPILRVASFAGFNSKPLYELTKTERRYSTLKRDRFKRLECTFEFQNSRLQFALEAVKVLISRIMKTL